MIDSTGQCRVRAAPTRPIAGPGGASSLHPIVACEPSHAGSTIALGTTTAAKPTHALHPRRALAALLASLGASLPALIIRLGKRCIRR